MLCTPNLSILVVWDIFKASQPYCIKVPFDKQFQYLKGFKALLNVRAAGPSNKSYEQEMRAQVDYSSNNFLMKLYKSTKFSVKVE